MARFYDTQQVCLNGHLRNDTSKRHPEANEVHCSQCGQKTITQCPECSTDIRGAMFVENPKGGRPSQCQSLTVAPAYCLNCGKPYPWTENKIIAAIQVFAELGVDESTIDEDMHNIAKDIPQAKPSAIRIERICKKLGPIAYNIVMEFATKTTAEILKGNIT